MAKQLGNENHYRLFPKRVMRCGCCHRDFVSEPFILEVKLYAHNAIRTKARCWRCVRSREACELIMQKWPNLYIMLKRGQFYYLDFRGHLVDFFRSEAE